MSSGDAAPTTPIRAAVVGRDEELTRLTDLADMAVEHGARMVLLSGEAGIGKSTLTAYFLEQLRQSGWGTHVGHCIEYADRPLPFGPVVAVLRSLLLDDLERVDHLVGHHREDLAGLVPELGDGDAGTASLAGDVDRLFDAIASLLGRASEGRPIAFLIEDVHWSDAATRDLLTSLVHNLRSARVLMLVTERSGALEKGNPLRTWLAEQRRFPNVHSIELEGLAQEDLAAQVTSLTGEEADISFVADLFQRTGGNPYFAHELVVAHGQRSGELPSSLREFLTSRLSQLGDDEREVLRAVAIAGGSVAHPVLASMLADLNLGPVIRTLFDTGILQVEGSTYHFSHALLREAILQDVLPFEAEALHRAAAEALDASMGPKPGVSEAVALALHWAAAGQAERSVPASIRAGELAASVAAFETAADMALHALEMWPSDGATTASPSDRSEVLRHAADWLQACFRGAEADQLLVGALEGWAADLSEPEVAQIMAKRAAILVGLGQPDTARSVLGVAQSLVEGSDSVEAVDVHYNVSQRALEGGDIVTAREAADRVVAIAERVGPERLLVEGLLTQALAVGVMEDLAAALELIHKARAQALANGYVPQVARSYRIEMSVVLHQAGRTPECINAISAGLEFAREHCGPRIRTDFEHDLSLALVEAGRFEDAKPFVEHLVGAEPDVLHKLWIRQTAALFELGVGDLARAEGHLREVEALSAKYNSPQETGFHHRIEAELRRRSGELDAARRFVDAALALQLDSDNLSFTRESLLEKAKIALAAERAGVADPALVAETRQQAAGFSGPGLANEAVAAAVSAYLDLADDRSTASVPDAVGLLATAGFEYEAAQLRSRWAEHALRSGERDAAADQLQRTLDSALASGSLWLANEARSIAAIARVQLSDAGSPLDQDEPPSRELPHHLTEREVEVMSLLAEGMTNKAIGAALFVSPRTVSTHVSNVLAKLGVTTRGEAAAAYHRLELADFVGDLTPTS